MRSAFHIFLNESVSSTHSYLWRERYSALFYAIVSLCILPIVFCRLRILCVCVCLYVFCKCEMIFIPFVLFRRHSSHLNGSLAKNAFIYKCIYRRVYGVHLSLSIFLFCCTIYGLYDIICFYVVVFSMFLIVLVVWCLILPKGNNRRINMR